MRKRYHKLKLQNQPDNMQMNLNTLETVLTYMERGDLEVVVQAADDELLRKKKQYFAMVKELGREAGYQSREEQEMFKQQIKQVLKVPSIMEIDDLDDMRATIEALRREASETFNYTRFTCDDQGYRFEDLEPPQAP